MRGKTKTGFIIFLIGFLILVFGSVLSLFEIIPIATNFDAMFIMVFVFVVAFILMIIGGRMLK